MRPRDMINHAICTVLQSHVFEREVFYIIVSRKSP